MGSNVKLYRVNEVAHNLGLSKKSFLFLPAKGSGLPPVNPDLR
jgi:hypothetical protein